jgi:hypothetical protein
MQHVQLRPELEREVTSFLEGDMRVFAEVGWDQYGLDGHGL